MDTYKLEFTGLGEGAYMEIKNLDNSMLAVALLDECNFSCIHCSREDYMYPGYKLSFEQMETCLSDYHHLQSIQHLGFTGGEPTLWMDRDMAFVDLLLEVAKAGYRTGFTTNGSRFTDYNECHDFFEGYFSNSSNALHVFISVDTFHGNFDAEKGRAKSLDNVLKYKMDMLSEKRELLTISGAATISRDSSSLLPDEMVAHYKSLGLGFGFRALMPRGRAKSLSHLCSNLESDKPEDLGAYHRFRPKEKREPPRHLVLFDNDCYFSNPLQNIAQLGNLPETIVQAYSL